MVVTWSDLPQVLLARVLEFADQSTLASAEATSVATASVVAQFHLWRSLAGLCLCVSDPPLGHQSACTCKQLLKLAGSDHADRESLLTGVRDYSSVDHDNESAGNTLTRSTCDIEIAMLAESVLARHPFLPFQELAERLQLQCGCAQGRPCYWSTASTWTSTTSDYIEYTLQPNSLVASVEIVPYRVYWYPGSPTYGPQRVSFQLFELLRTEDGVPPDSANLSAPVYESPVYDVLNDMKLQSFPLPKRAFLARGVVRLVLHDRQEEIARDVMRWMESNHLPPYYICLSYAGATGLANATE